MRTTRIAGLDVPLGPDQLPVGWPQDHGIATLAWDVLAWAEEMLAQPDGDDAGDPWQWTAYQARILSWWYAVDKNGNWTTRRGQIVMPKGAGKSPFAAAIACCELLGPVKFNGFDSNGEAIGKPHPSPVVQLAAVSESQARNTMDLVIPMINLGQIKKERPDIDPGLTRVRTSNGTLTPITASPSSQEGARATAIVADETHTWTPARGGSVLAAVIRRNTAKTKGRTLETTNGWRPGEDSEAQKTFEAWQNIVDGRAPGSGILRFHPEAHVEDLSDIDEVRAALTELYSESPWIGPAGIDRFIEEIFDTGTTPSDARRFYLNQIASAEDGWVMEHEWSGRYFEKLEPRPTPITDGDMITLGFDGSRRRSRGVPDATALIGCRVSDGHVFEIKVWEAPKGPEAKNWVVPTTEVDAEVRNAFKQYNVIGFYADPAKWETFVADWEAKYGGKLKVKASRSNPVTFWFSGRGQIIARALEQFHTAIVDGEMSHDGASALTRHVLNARVRMRTSGVHIDKEHPESERKIDAAVAATLAWAARLDAVAAGILEKRGPSRGFTF